MRRKNINISANKILVLALIVILGTAPQVLAESWTCEDALLVCTAMNWTPVSQAGFFRCMMGYSFCVDYVKQHLK